MPIAITRVPPRSIVDSTRIPSGVTIDADAAIAQHGAYEEALRELGVQVVSLPALDGYPDSAFVGDLATVLDEVAVLGPVSGNARSGESQLLATVLTGLRTLASLEAPATYDASDVARVASSLFVVRSGRTNRAAIEQLREIVRPFGYGVHLVPVVRCHRLRHAMSWLGDGAVVIDAVALDPGVSTGLGGRIVEAAEPTGANALRVGDTVLLAASAPLTRDRIDAAGIRTRAVDISELQNAGAGIGCLSLLVG